MRNTLVTGTIIATALALVTGPTASAESNTMVGDVIVTANGYRIDIAIVNAHTEPNGEFADECTVSITEETFAITNDYFFIDSTELIGQWPYPDQPGRLGVGATHALVNGSAAGYVDFAAYVDELGGDPALLDGKAFVVETTCWNESGSAILDTTTVTLGPPAPTGSFDLGPLFGSLSF